MTVAMLMRNTLLCARRLHKMASVRAEEKFYILHLHALGELCCVALSFCCVVLPCLSF